MSYTASKSSTKDRPGFSISFRHPLRMDAESKPGLKMRRGLGTTDPKVADDLVSQMNTLLGDKSWWNANRRSDAAKLFHEIIVDAFFDGLEASEDSAALSASLRGSIVPLPGRVDGYAHVLFVGTTGAGKTSLLRHLIGSNPHRDRFPSTSTAKTTVSDIEVIPQQGSYLAAVTFFPKDVIRASVEDCLVAACGAVWDAMDDEKVADRLLHHADQRFRLSYILGAWNAAGTESEEDWDFGGEGNSAPLTDDRETVTAADAAALQIRLADYVQRVKAVAQAQATKIRQVRPELQTQSLSVRSEDVQADLESELFVDDSFDELVRDIMEQIQRRFDHVTVGTLTQGGKKTAHWPDLWTYESADRDDFLRQVRWFSSNYAPAFGRLLTPLVDGIRVRGPLYPDFTDRRAKVVYRDGQGLGHTPDSASSVTTHVTQRFAEVDAILLVDNAEQPVQAAAQAVLRAVAASGNYRKLAIAFTHFDQVRGLNLPGFAAKRAHVLASVHNYLARLREVLSGPIVAAMERTIDDQCYMLGGLDAASERMPAGVRAQLGSLLDQVERSIEPHRLPDAKPEYDLAELGPPVQRAAEIFQRAWNLRLGFADSAEVSAEHWTRIKALNRRIANKLDVEYDSLQPVADFVGRLTEEIANYLDNPARWSRAPKDNTEAQEAITPIRQAVFAGLHALAEERLVHQQLDDWRRSNDRKGLGSATRRAVDIRGIYEMAAPVLATVNEEHARAFTEGVRKIVLTATERKADKPRASEAPQVDVSPMDDVTAFRNSLPEVKQQQLSQLVVLLQQRNGPLGQQTTIGAYSDQPRGYSGKRARVFGIVTPGGKTRHRVGWIPLVNTATSPLTVIFPASARRPDLDSTRFESGAGRGDWRPVDLEDFLAHVDQYLRD
jgi:hypothetical protein